MGKTRKILPCACGAAPKLILLEDGFTVRCPNTPAWVVNVGHKTEEKAIKHWNDMQEGMDNISRKAMIAQHTGTQYGQHELAKKVSVPEEDTQVPTGKKKRTTCLNCSKRLPKTRTKFCCDECSIAYNRDKRRELERNRYQKKIQKARMAEN